MFTLQSGKQHAVAFVQNTRDEVRLMGGDGQIVGALPAQPGAKQQCYVVHGTQDPIVLDDLALPLGRNNGAENAVCVTGDITRTLKAEGFDASEDGTGRGQPIVTAYAFQPRIARNGRGDMGDVVNAINSQSGETGKGDAAPCVAQGMAVRRLMPIEAERLQGFEDNWTLVPVGKGMAADGPRYRQLGNSWAVPCVAWIGRRIQAELNKAVEMKPQQVDGLTVWMLAP